LEEIRGIGVYFSKVEICQNIEEFLTTKAHQGAEGRNKALEFPRFGGQRVKPLC
jgi:hypothetical protein